jgi:hypothetical protein
MFFALFAWAIHDDPQHLGKTLQGKKRKSNWY